MKEDQLVEAFAAIGLTLQPGLDTTSEGRYAVYAYDTEGSLYGDDCIGIEYRSWVVVFVAPLAVDERSTRQQIRQIIEELFGVRPSEEDATGDTGGQKFLYAFETIEV